MSKSRTTMIKANYFLTRRLETYMSYPEVWNEEDGISEKHLVLHLSNPNIKIIDNVVKSIDETFLRFGIRTFVKSYITSSHYDGEVILNKLHKSIGLYKK